MKVFRDSEYNLGRTTILEAEGKDGSFEVKCEVDAALLIAVLENVEVHSAR
jgi:hypothetical protein